MGLSFGTSKKAYLFQLKRAVWVGPKQNSHTSSFFPSFIFFLDSITNAQSAEKTPPYQKAMQTRNSCLHDLWSKISHKKHSKKEWPLLSSSSLSPFFFLLEQPHSFTLHHPFPLPSLSGWAGLAENKGMLLQLLYAFLNLFNPFSAHNAIWIFSLLHDQNWVRSCRRLGFQSTKKKNWVRLILWFRLWVLCHQCFH